MSNVLPGRHSEALKWDAQAKRALQMIGDGCTQLMEALSKIKGDELHHELGFQTFALYWQDRRGQFSDAYFRRIRRAMTALELLTVEAEPEAVQEVKPAPNGHRVLPDRTPPPAVVTTIRSEMVEIGDPRDYKLPPLDDVLTIEPSEAQKRILAVYDEAISEEDLDSPLTDEPDETDAPRVKGEIERLTPSEIEQRKAKLDILLTDARDFLDEALRGVRSMAARKYRTSFDDDWYRGARDSAAALLIQTGQLETAMFSLLPGGGGSYVFDSLAEQFCKARGKAFLKMEPRQRKDFNLMVSTLASQGRSIWDAFAGYLYRLDVSLEREFAWRSFLWSNRQNDWLSADQARRASKHKLDIEALDVRL